MPDHPVPEPKISSLRASSTGVESDLGELAALFASRGGGGLSPEVSTDLALEVVLNEIVEQACLATGATGAAIMLLRDGEMVCRASNGENAPQLGAPLGSESGLTAECIRTRKVQRCDDAQSDPRADAEASRSLGVRSVMIFPLLQKGEMAGVLEVFSPIPSAFGDRDEHTLEAYTRRILQNLERANEPLSLAGSVAKNAAPPNPVEGLVSPWVSDGEESRADSAVERGEQDVAPLEASLGSTRAGINFVSWALAAAVLACTLLLGTLVGIRLGWRGAAGVRGPVVKTAHGSVLTPPSTAQNMVIEERTAGNGPTPANGESVTNALAGAGISGGSRNEKKNGSARAGKRGDEPPPGSLLVYEDGKEVFRMPPGGELRQHGGRVPKEPERRARAKCSGLPPWNRQRLLSCLHRPKAACSIGLSRNIPRKRGSARFKG